MGARAVIFDLVLLFLLLQLGGLLLLLLVNIVTEIKTVNAPMFKLEIFFLFFDFSTRPVRGHGTGIMAAQRLTDIRN